MPIVAPTPTEVPASGNKTYDKYWLKHFQIVANPAEKVRVMSILHKAREVNGTWELSPVDPDVVILVEDFDSLATNDPSLTTLKNSLLDKISAIAIAQNKI